MKPDVPVRSVKKALDLLSILAFEDRERRGIALTALAHRMEMPVNSTHNLLKTMVFCGYVAQTEGGAYLMGLRAEEMGRLSLLLSTAASAGLRGRMDTLCVALEEAVTLAALADGRRILLCRADPHQVIRVNSAVLETRSLFAMPTGRVLAAFSSPNELECILRQSGLPVAEWAGISTRAALDKALGRIRRRGHEVIAPDVGGLVSLAVPVLDGKGERIAALGCYAPLFRCDPDRQGFILSQLRLAAEGLIQVL